MGKTKQRRFQTHASALKLNSCNETTSLINKSSAEQTLQPIEIVDNLFKDIPINIDDLQKPKDVDFDAKSISNKSNRDIKKEEQHLSKNEKMRRRHGRFIAKLELVRNLKKELQARKKREKRAIVGDMIPLLEALPSTDELESPTKQKEVKLKPRVSMKAKRRQKEHLKDIKHFQRVLNDKTFCSNPATAITEFLKQKVAAERPDLQLL